jgi:hypothetical protein
VSRHEVQVAPDIKFIVGHCNNSRTESHPSGDVTLAGPVFAMLYIGEVGHEPDEHAPMLRDPDEVLDWAEEQLDKYDRMPETEEVWEEWMGMISKPMVMEGKDGPNIRMAAAMFAEMDDRPGG